MLKRQRPSSPLPHPMDAARELPEDLYNPHPKRRRYFQSAEYDKSPLLLTPQGEASTEAGEEISTYEQRQGGKEWQQRAGEYKAVNSLLHDLHAEQRHRVIFASPTNTGRDHFHPSADSTTYPSTNSACTPEPHPQHLLRKVEAAEITYQRYGDTNKFLGSLVLSRRRYLDNSNTSSPQPASSS